MPRKETYKVRPPRASVRQISTSKNRATYSVCYAGDPVWCCATLSGASCSWIYRHGERRCEEATQGEPLAHEVALSCAVRLRCASCGGVKRRLRSLTAFTLEGFPHSVLVPSPNLAVAKGEVCVLADSCSCFVQARARLALLSAALLTAFEQLFARCCPPSIQRGGRVGVGRRRPADRTG